MNGLSVATPAYRSVTAIAFLKANRFSYSLPFFLPNCSITDEMSVHLNLPVEVDTMVCTTCGTESFAWLAEVFACPTCGEFKFAFPTTIIGNDRDNDNNVDEGREVDTVKARDVGVRVKGRGRKRKRSDSEEKAA